jgi:hypothetical protein
MSPLVVNVDLSKQGRISKRREQASLLPEHPSGTIHGPVDPSANVSLSW